MIHFITPLYRYNNIKIIYSTIINQTTDFKWHLIEGSNNTGCDSLSFLDTDDRVIRYKMDTNYIWGHEQRNYFIYEINGNDDDWCYFLDDDNVVTNDLIVGATSNENKSFDVVVFSQKKGLTEMIRLYAHIDSFKLGGVDIGSFLIKYKTIKKTFIYPITERNADGHYAEQIKRLPDININYCIDKYVRYNSLSLEIS
jgi:hypothetical protein